ncbi:MAG: hypothetical protein ACTSQW_04185 [Promethearchaeota archaeon]
MWVKGLKIHRATSWLITLFALITILLGYAATRRWFPEYELFLFLHGVTGWIFPGLLLVHFILSIIYLKLNLRRIIKGLKNEKISGTSTLRLVQRITKWGIIVFAILISLSGLTYYPWFVAIFGNFFEFTLHLDLDLILSMFMIVHVGIGAKFYLTRRKVTHWGVDLSIIFLIFSLLITAFIIDLPAGFGDPQVNIAGRIYFYNPEEVETNRLDLYQNGSFSVFDVLLHLDSKGEIDLDYHFNASMNTYVIDNLNGVANWWYNTYYSGGNFEKNVVRMDHFTWKPGTQIRLYHESESYINNAYSLFKEEVDRFATNNNSIIIPIINITGKSFSEVFYNLTVFPHNLRNETFQQDIILAIDVIMTLGDLGYITYELTYHETFRSAGYVHSYFVSKINADETEGRCGFLFDINDLFIWVSADERILTSPESLNFYWDCV